MRRFAIAGAAVPSLLLANSAVAAAVTLAERWNGTKWSIQPTPNPTGGSDHQQ